jgi:Putative adhesin
MKAQRAWKACGVVWFLVGVTYTAVTLIDLVSTRTERQPTQTFGTFGTDNPVTSLVIRTDGKIHIIGKPLGSTAITVETQTRYGARRSTVTKTLSGKTLTLKGSCPVILSATCFVDFTIRVPMSVKVDAHSNSGAVRVESMASEVRASSSGGSVSVDKCTGRQVLYSSGGSVTMRRSGGSVDADSTAGEVSGTDLSAKSVIARSSSGKVALAFDQPPQVVNASSSAGSVIVIVPPDSSTYVVIANGQSSEIGVKTDPASTRSINANSSAGTVSVMYAD